MKKEEQILKSIVNNPDIVKLHRPWGYYIETPFEAIHMIGLIDKVTHYELSLFFGDTQRQSRAFYNLKPELNQFDFSDWIMRSNFHLQNSFGENLIWFGTKLKNQDYIDFWVNNRQLFYKHPKSGISKLLDNLEENGVTVLDIQKRAELKAIFSKDYSAFNICAGFGLIYSISKKDITDLENSGRLGLFLSEKINSGLKLIGESGISFLINFDVPFYPEETLEGDPDGL